MSQKAVNIAEQRFNRLVAISIAGRDKRRGTIWLCRCDCGVEKIIKKANLMNGNTRSCGCLQKEIAAKRLSERVITTHRQSQTCEYRIWGGMMVRCERPSSPRYKDYGGRGIDVCERWRLFENFRADMGERPGKQYSIERIDNNKGYSPDNCVWATREEQSRNKRSNVMVLINGQSKCVQEWSSIYGIKHQTIRRSLIVGWPPEKAVATPVMVKKASRGKNI